MVPSAVATSPDAHRVGMERLILRYLIVIICACTTKEPYIKQFKFKKKILELVHTLVIWSNWAAEENQIWLKKCLAIYIEGGICQAEN